jgi:hypothetical protein
MRVQTVIPDDDLIDDCISLTYNVEIGELYESDRYSWIEVPSNTVSINKHAQDDEDIFFKKVKSLDFEFKMNHIKQVIKIEIVGNYKKTSDQALNNKTLCKHATIHFYFRLFFV